MMQRQRTLSWSSSNSRRSSRNSSSSSRGSCTFQNCRRPRRLASPSSSTSSSLLLTTFIVILMFGGGYFVVDMFVDAAKSLSRQERIDDAKRVMRMKVSGMAMAAAGSATTDGAVGATTAAETTSTTTTTTDGADTMASETLLSSDTTTSDAAAAANNNNNNKKNNHNNGHHIVVVDHVSHTAEAARNRHLQLRKKKRKAGGWFSFLLLGRRSSKETSLTDVLFPGMTPEAYQAEEPIAIWTDFVNSRKTQVPFQYYDLPSCPNPTNSFMAQYMNNNNNNNNRTNNNNNNYNNNNSHLHHHHHHHHKWKNNFGSRLQGAGSKSYQMAPYYPLFVLQNQSTCRPLCQVQIGGKKLRWMRKLVERQYRIHLTLDQLPVLMRSSEWNYAVRGFPVGFAAPPSYTGLAELEYYLYNHLHFTITYYEDAQEFQGIRITGFDVHPVSFQHALDESPQAVAAQAAGVAAAAAGSSSDASASNSGGNWIIPTCNGPNAKPVVNDPKTYLALRTGPTGEDLNVVFSYQVTWEKRDLKWADRWDVYLIGSPDDDIHYFAIVNSLMIVLFLTGAIATIMIRTLRKDIAGYNEIQTLEESQEETGWKLVHGDVFRPPHVSPMLLSVLVGTGAQIGTSFFWSMMCAMIGLVNPMNKGQTLTAIIFLYVLSGSVAGYVSARLYKFFTYGQQAMRTSLAITTTNNNNNNNVQHHQHHQQQHHHGTSISSLALPSSQQPLYSWKRNAVMTAVALPGLLVTMFLLLNIFLRLAGAATAVGLFTVVALFALWTCVSTPLVLLGSYLGFAAPVLQAPTKTNPIARMIPENVPWYSKPPVSMLLGGILPFGSVCIELFFIMSALWLHQIYYVMGFLLAVLLILAATCAEVSVVMCYVQLCAEDHRWWWKSFWNCASAGMYLFVYSLWFLSSRLELVGVLPVVVYLTYMSMMSICFGLFCGSVGLLMCGWFTRTIYGALKVD